MKYASLAIYVTGLAALFMADMVVSKFFPPEEIKIWAEVRSLIGISGILCLVGLDQVLVRSPHSSSRLLKILAIQIPLLALIVGVGVWYLGFLSHWVIAAAIAAGSSGSLALFQYFRSHRRNVKSQLAQQVWKVGALLIVLWVTVLSVYIPLDAAVATMLISSVIGVGLFLIKERPALLRQQVPESVFSLYQIGVRFMVTSLLLAFAVYAEQLIVNRLGTSGEAAIYFTHSTFFMFPIAAVNGYFAFLIGPWVRDNHQRFIQIFFYKIAWVYLGVVVYVVSFSFFGWLGWILVNPSVGAPDGVLQGLFIAGAIARTTYAIPSGYLGVFGRPKQHDLLIFGQLLILGVVFSFLFLVIWFDWMALMPAVASASALNWSLRAWLGFAVTRLVINANHEK